MNKETLLTYEELIEKVKSFPSGTIIPKPQSENEFTIKGLGRRRNEEALIYKIPTNKPDKYPNGHEKGITFKELYSSYITLQETSRFERKWLADTFPKCVQEGPCNFTTIGGIFELLGVAQYDKPGCYRRKEIIL